MQRRDILREAGEPFALDASLRPVDQERRADLDHDPAELLEAGRRAGGGGGRGLAQGVHATAFAFGASSCALAASISACRARRALVRLTLAAAEIFSGARLAARFRRKACCFRVSASTLSIFDRATISGLSARPPP